jgi:hypothetical protein
VPSPNFALAAVPGGVFMPAFVQSTTVSEYPESSYRESI